MWLADLPKHLWEWLGDVHDRGHTVGGERPPDVRLTLDLSCRELGLAGRDDVRRSFEHDRQIGAGQEPREGASDGRGNVQAVAARVDSDVEKPALDHDQPGANARRRHLEGLPDEHVEPVVGEKSGGDDATVGLPRMGL